MKNKKPLLRIINAIILTTIAPLAAPAETPSSGFGSEADRSMTAAHESFLKGDLKRASEAIDRAAATVNKESREVAASARESVKRAGRELAQLGKRVKAGAVKSDEELKKTFGHVDNELAKAWHATAEESMNAGRDASDALKKAGESLSGAARWSGRELKKGSRASVAAVRAMGKDLKAGGEQVHQWLRGIGDGIREIEQKP